MRSTGNNFFRFRALNVVACLIAVLAMSASAISACACNHHKSRVKAEEKPSCHSTSHSEPAVSSQDVPDSDSLHSGCNCFVNDRIPAITAKSESKKFSAEKINPTGEKLVSPAPLLLYSYAGPANFHSPRLDYSGRFVTSGPSRAPPRM